MREWKRIIAVVLSVLMLVTAIPLSESGVQASTNGVQEKIDKLRSVYATGTYFTKSGGPASRSNGWADSQLTGIPARGGLPAGSTLGVSGTSCWAFATYCFYYIFGHLPSSNVTQVSSPAIGDFLNFGGNHYAIYLGSYNGGYYIYDCNGTDAYNCVVRYQGQWSKTSNVIISRSNRYNQVYGVTTPSVSYATITTGKYYIKNNSTGTYLNVDGGTDTNTQNVSVASFTGGTSMQMEITSATNGYKIRPMCSSSRLVNPYADYVSSGVNVNIYNNVNDSSQWWGFEKVSGGYVIRNMQNQNCVLALSGTNVIVSTYTGAANQIWSLEPYDTYTISYNANGGSGAPSSQTKVHGIAVALSTTKPTRTGYKFLGWSTSSSATSATYASGATYSANGNVTLYAVWEANTYTVTYNANGGTGAPSSQTKTYGVNLTLYAKEPTRSGYTFLGWGTSASATSTTYAPGGTYTKNESITLYAVWQKNTYTTYFDSNGGTNSIYAVRQAGEDITFPIYEPYREYHVFLGWADSATSTTAQYTLGQTIQAGNGDKTFYAVWKAPTVMEDGVEYTITFGAEHVEKYFSFTPKKDGYYMVDESVLTNCGEILWCDENGTSSFESSLKYLEDDITYYFKATNEWNYDGEGDVTLSVTYTPITHMEAVSTRTVLPSQNRHYYWYDIEPIYTIYAGGSIYFEGNASDFHSNMDLGWLTDNLYDITVWTEGTQIVEVYLGDLSCQMEVNVQARNVVSIEPIGENKLIENYDGYMTTDYNTNETYFRYRLYSYNKVPFKFIATYDNGYMETLDRYATSFNYIDPQNSQNAWEVGKHTVVCEYMGISAEFEVEIEENPVASLKVLTDGIKITESTCGYYSTYNDKFIYSISEVLENNPIKLYVSYKSGADQIIVVNDSVPEVEIDGSVTGVGAENHIKISFWGNLVNVPVEVLENPDLDLIVSAKVIEIPEHSGTYPVGGYYDCAGVKVEVTMESGATEVFTVDKLWGECTLSKYKCQYSASNHIQEGQNEIVVQFCGLTIPVTVVTGTAAVESFEFLTMPKEIGGTGAKMRLYYADGTSQEVNILSVEERQGASNCFMFVEMQTDKGFYFHAKYNVAVLDNVEMLYGVGGYSLDDGFWVSLSDAEMRAKILAIVAAQYFKESELFSGEQTKDNINDIVSSALLYYYYDYDCDLQMELSIDDLKTQIQRMFAIEGLDLTKSKFYNVGKNNIFVDVSYGEFGLGDLFSNAVQLYADIGESWVFQYTRDEMVTYIEIQKSTNQIRYIGDTYKIATIKSVSVASQPQKTNYYVGDTLDISGLQLQLDYSDGTTEIITEGFTVSEFDAYQVGTQMIIITYEGMNTVFNVSVEMPRITISSKEETLEIDGTVSLNADTIPSLQTVTWISSDESIASIEDETVTAVAPGTAVITAQFTYNGQIYSQTCVVTVNKPLPTVTSLMVVTNPAKTNYIVGENLDATGLSLRVDYDNGTSEIVSEGFEVIGYDASKVGVQTLEVMYADVTTNLTVTISNPELDLSDTERTMVIGGTVQLRVDTIPTGQTVTWKSSDTSVATVENGLVTAVNSGVTVVSTEFVYGGKTYSKECTITVIASLTSIEIATTPNKTVYQIDEELDTTGLSLRLNYDDGTTKVVTDGFTTYGYDAGKVGTQVITVYYHGHASAYTVVVEVDENAPQIIVESKKNIAGKTVTVDIILKNNPGIASATLKLNFDTSVLTLIKVTDAGNLGIQCHKPEFTSPYTLSWMNDTATEDFTFNGTIVTLTFEIAEDAELGDYTIDLSYDYDNYDIWNVNVEKVKFAVVDGVISVIDTIIGDANGDGAVNTLDRMALARYLANWEGYSAETIDMIAADVNNDGIVNTLDRMALARHLANWSGYEALPCEI